MRHEEITLPDVEWLDPDGCEFDSRVDEVVE